jgi:tetratricopeptide (TPR) repeat protein
MIPNGRQGRKDGIELDTTIAGLAIILFLCPGATCQSLPLPGAAPTGTAVLQGVIRDERKHPVAGAQVRLKTAGSPAREAESQSDSSGLYRFANLVAGRYEVTAKLAGKRTAVQTLAVASGESRTLDLDLQPIADSGATNVSALPEFSDDVHFTVAGVIDTTNLGGHGSDVVVRNREALAQATAALDKVPPRSKPSAESALREQLARNPEDFPANYQLGKMLVESGQAAEAIPFLRHASDLGVPDFDARYELGLAYCRNGNEAEARGEVQSLTKIARSVGQSARIQHLLGEIEEASNHPLAAVRKYEEAAKLDPNESNLFDWGAELLVHHAPDPAREVFARGNRLFPRSVRMLEGLAAAFYERGSFEEAVQRLCQASDLDPYDPNPYLFMGKMEDSQSALNPAIIEKLARFVKLHPELAMAHLYYASALWERRRSPEDGSDLMEVKRLLNEALALDPDCAVASLQLGIVEAGQKEFPEAISHYQRAIVADPSLEQAHYRLAQLYRQTGETAKAREELLIYERISREQEKEIEQRRHRVQQFVYRLRDGTPPAASADPNK